MDKNTVLCLDHTESVFLGSPCSICVLETKLAVSNARLAEAERWLDVWARLHWAINGPDDLLWSHTVKFLGDKYTGRGTET